MKKLKIGIIGCGTIGSKLALVIDKELKGKAVLVGLCDVDTAKIDKLRSNLKSSPATLNLPNLFLGDSRGRISRSLYRK